MIPRAQNLDFENTQSTIVDIGLDDPVGVSWRLFSDKSLQDVWKTNKFW